MKKNLNKNIPGFAILAQPMTTLTCYLRYRHFQVNYIASVWVFLPVCFKEMLQFLAVSSYIRNIICEYFFIGVCVCVYVLGSVYQPV